MRATLAAIFFVSRVVQAHPSHGVAGGSFTTWHYLSEPMLISVVGLLAIAGLVVARLGTDWNARTS